MARVTRATHRPDINLIPAPERGVWRLGKSKAPLKYEWLSDPAVAGDASSSGNRWSLVGYGTLYCASSHDGCFAEALATFRVHPTCSASSRATGRSRTTCLPGRYRGTGGPGTPWSDYSPPRTPGSWTSTTNRPWRPSPTNCARNSPGWAWTN
ncbi:RES domain-containing protein [Streptomyces sp. M19]